MTDGDAAIVKAVQAQGNLLVRLFAPNLPRQASGSGSGDDAMGVVVAKIAAVLAPLSAFGTVVSSATSGFRPFLTVVNLLGSTLGQVLMPVFAVLGSVVYALSETLKD